MMNCQQASRLTSEAQDRTLSVTETMRLKVHLMICTGCKNFSLQVPFLSQAMKAYGQGGKEEPTADTKKP